MTPESHDYSLQLFQASVKAARGLAEAYAGLCETCTSLQLETSTVEISKKLSGIVLGLAFAEIKSTG